MTKFDKEFFDKFPLLYKNCNFIGCDNGWYDLLYELSEKLENILKNNSSVSITVDQIKKKFGGLRFYTSSNTDSVYEIINEYEAKSYQTCEFCGKQPATQNGKSWIRTTCDYCENIKDIIE